MSKGLRILIACSSLVTFLGTGMFASIVSAQENEQEEWQELEPPPEIEALESGQIIETPVEIRPGRQEGVTEYWVNGGLRGIKVQPSIGPAYWLYDTDGDGVMDLRRSSYQRNLLIPHWRILSW